MVDDSTLLRIQQAGIVAVIRGPTVDLTYKMVDALVKGGIIGIEITFSTPNADLVVKELARTFGDRITLGMGTITNVTHMESAQAAGAQFLVSPMYEPELAGAMLSSGLPLMIGALTPSEVYRVYSLGSDVVKLFPGSLVGPSYVKALKGPFPQIPLIPTGGVNIENIQAWFAAGVFAVGVGSQLCPPSLAKEDRFDDITQNAEKFVTALLTARNVMSNKSG